MFLDLIIREDLKDGPTITPDSPPSREILTPLGRSKVENRKPKSALHGTG
jgi:hypothetical protein